MTAVPKPLKFLRPHYEALEKAYASWPAGENKRSLADMMSVLGMTYSESASTASSTACRRHPQISAPGVTNTCATWRSRLAESSRTV